MGVVLAVPSIDREEVTPPRYQRIRRQSRWLAWVITGLLALYCAFMAALAGGELAIDGSLVHLGPGGQATFSRNGNFPVGSVALGDFAPWQRAGFALVLLAGAVPPLMAMLNLRALFRLYAEGRVFAQVNARHIRQIGVWLIVCSATPFLMHAASLPLGNNFDNEVFHMSELHELVLGAILLVVAQVMAAGHEIEQDRDQFV